jgi:hypothetical protein
MADLPKTKVGLFARMRHWVQGQLIEEVPPEMERCEFDCRNLECTLGEWKTCENRLKSMRHGKG